MKVFTVKNRDRSKQWIKGFAAVGSTLLISTFASGAEAASLTFNFSGLVDSLSGYSFARGIDTPVEKPLSDVNSRNNSSTITNQDRIVGQYTFDDTNGKLLSSRLRFVAPNSNVSQDPSVSAPEDIVFEPLPDIIFDPSNGMEPFGRVTTASANDTSANYTVGISNGFSGSETRFVLSNKTFSYIEAGGAVSDGSYLTRATGTIDTFSPVSTNPGNPDPTTVPEPSAVVGLLTVAGLGLAARKRVRS